LLLYISLLFCIYKEAGYEDIDVILAAVAISYKCKLLHKDSDFDFIAKHFGVAIVWWIREVEIWLIETRVLMK